jgi:catechol 2,3-dioxygenase-like lactoylglutathione lyase family enzyme
LLIKELNDGREDQPVFGLNITSYMPNLPTPKLGKVYAITIGTADLEKSLAFYQQLGFKELLRADIPFSWIQVTDGALLIMLRKEDKPYIALTYYVQEIDQLVADLEAQGITFATKPNPGDMIKRCLMKSSDGLNISLVGYVESFKQPEGATMLTMPQSDLFNAEKYVNKVCGMFGEFAHPVKDLDQSIAFWQQLGFVSLSKMDAPYKWAILSDGLSIVGLHQTDSFDYPAITFFAADMKDKIEKLKQEGLTDFVEKGAASIVVTTPEGQHINLFKLGM